MGVMLSLCAGLLVSVCVVAFDVSHVGDGRLLVRVSRDHDSKVGVGTGRQQGRPSGETERFAPKRAEAPRNSAGPTGRAQRRRLVMLHLMVLSADALISGASHVHSATVRR